MNERTIAHAQLVLRPLAVAVEILAEGAQIEEEDGHVQARLVLLGEDRFLGGGHAADRGAVVVVAARVARADALDERQPLGRPCRRWGGRTCPRVGPEAESIRSNCTLVSTLGAKPKPNSPRRVASKASKPGVSTTLPTSRSDGLLRLVVVDGPGLADLGAQAALARLEMDAVLAVDDRHARRGLGMGQVDARPGAQVLVDSR